MIYVFYFKYSYYRGTNNLHRKTMYKCKIINDYITRIRKEYDYYFVNMTLIYPNGQSSTFFMPEP